MSRIGNVGGWVGQSTFWWSVFGCSCIFLDVLCVPGFLIDVPESHLCSFYIDYYYIAIHIATSSSASISFVTF